MSTYKFFVTEGPEGKFSASNKAIRSHAMKTALRTRKQRADNTQDTVLSLADSEEVVRRKGELSGRFRLPKRSKGNKKGEAIVPDQQVASSRSKSLISPSVVTLTTNNPLSGGQASQALARRQGQPIQRFGNGTADPFQSLPVPNKGQVDILVKYGELSPHIPKFSTYSDQN